MDEDELLDETQHAEELLEDEAIRSSDRAACPDPGQRRGAMSDEDVASLRKRHAFLEDFSDAFIRSQTVGDLMKIETTSMKVRDWEKAKDADDRLAANKAVLASTFTSVQEGRDNRCSVLHPGRFLGGAGCSAAKLWLAAREALGTVSHPPIGNYDMGAVGLAGYVSAKGWTEAHNLQNPKVQVKMYNINNCGLRSSSKKAGDDPDDIQDAGEFKLALRVMRTVFQFTQPWNLSVLAIEGFFMQNNFCHHDLSNVEKKAWYLSKFTDFAMAQNADRWRDAEPFLSTGDLKVLWGSFFSAQPSQSKQGKDGASSSKKKDDRSKRPLDPKVTLGICFAWNQGQCMKPASACTTLKGRPLKHICDHVADPAKPTDVCGKDHRGKDHK